jgi:hypothetical protein
MNNISGLDFDEPFDPREVERLSCVRLGRVPLLEKSDRVWHNDGYEWGGVVIERRVAGGVFIARRISGRFKGFMVVVSCASYGGPL